MVVIEGVEGGKGQGFSKKEAQQLASKNTLDRLKKEPQFIDAIFQAKSERTKMEEEPTMAPPNLEADRNFIIEQGKPQNEDTHEAHEPHTPQKPQKSQEPQKPQEPQEEFDLSDISVNTDEPSREDIIAAAEAAAFAEG